MIRLTQASTKPWSSKSERYMYQRLEPASTESILEGRKGLQNLRESVVEGLWPGYQGPWMQPANVQYGATFCCNGRGLKRDQQKDPDQGQKTK